MTVEAVHGIVLLRMSCTALMVMQISPALKFYGIWARIVGLLALSITFINLRRRVGCTEAIILQL